MTAPANDPTGIPGWTRLQKSRDRWRALAAVSAVSAVAAVVFAFGVIGDLAATLDRRTPAIVYIEQLGEHDACVDQEFAEHDIAVGNVVLAAVTPEPAPGVPPGPSPEDFADDVAASVRDLQRLDGDIDADDPPGVLCQLPEPPADLLADPEAMRLILQALNP